jgi:hypothetical protein
MEGWAGPSDSPARLLLLYEQLALQKPGHDAPFVSRMRHASPDLLAELSGHRPATGRFQQRVQAVDVGVAP